MVKSGDNGLLNYLRPYKEADGRQDHHKWREAMEEEMRTIERKSVWTLTDLPAGRNSIATRWVYQLKKKSNGFIERYKARLVAKGFSQKPGTDFGLCPCYQFYNSTNGFGALSTAQTKNVSSGRQVGVLEWRTPRVARHRTARRIRR